MRPAQPLSSVYSAMQLIGKYLNNITCIDTRPGIPQDGGNQSNANGSATCTCRPAWNIWRG